MPRPVVSRPVLNVGLADATVGSCRRALDLLSAPLPAFLAILIIGTNDIRSPSALTKSATDDFVSQASRIVDRFQTWTLDTLVSALPPTPVSKASERDPAAVEVYSDLLRDVCVSRGVSFFDPFVPLRGTRFGLAEDQAFIDGMHLRDYGAVAARITGHIRDRYGLERYLQSPLPGFDEEYYRSWYADTCRYPEGLARHYLDVGWREGRDPSGHFSTDGYLDANPDVRVAGVNPLVHFLEVGFAQGRTGWQKSHAHPTRYRGSDPDT
ncbi:SGNH/GDSL hydrolase family protein [Methylobacterium sp. NMS14P]|uniref:SGNH/GDSL hydrolase family protein n=1 Tax=Methylobacterium sp. NMS14P TaxID=2894310 RepID=UPI002359D9E2|nr:SGNH/GDSL hydrolase family protein [Methylobacterium sp. NMS14P]WCS22747.1 SGNH/GDSL hydrolase family protein [Methylobacterium sp. NMS14P]